MFWNRNLKKQVYAALGGIVIFIPGCFEEEPLFGEDSEPWPLIEDDASNLMILGDIWFINNTNKVWGAIVEFDGYANPPNHCDIYYDLMGVSPIARKVLNIVVEDSQGSGHILNDGPGSNVDAINIEFTAQGQSNKINYSSPLDWHINRTLPLSSPSDKPIHFIAVAIRDLNNDDDFIPEMQISCDGESAGVQARRAQEIEWFDHSGNGEGTGAWVDFTTGRSGLGIESRYQKSTEHSALLGIEVDGDILTMHGAVGRIAISHPNGTDEWIIHPRQTMIEGASNPWRSYSFGPGTYSATFDFANVYPSAVVTGVWLAWSPPAIER